MHMLHNDPIPRDRRKIDLLHPKNVKVILLGMLGFDYRHIRRQTGFCNHEIRYRLNLAKVKLHDYRSGRSAAAKTVEAAALERFGIFLAQQLSEPGKRTVICVDGTLLIK